MTFYAVNQSFPEEKYDNLVSRKIYADIYIDDRNIGGILGWGEVFQLITKEEHNMSALKEKKGFFSFLKK